MVCNQFYLTDESNRLTHHYNKFLSLMQNTDITAKSLEASIHSENSALDESQKHINSVVGQWGIFKVKIEEIYSKLLTSDALKETISDFNKFIDVINKITDKFDLFKTTLGLAGAYMLAFKKDFNIINLLDDKHTNFKFSWGKNISNALDVAKKSSKSFNDTYSKLVNDIALSKGEMNPSFLTTFSARMSALTQTTIAQTVATIGLKAAQFALNAAIGFGIGLLINAGITALDNLIHRQENLKKAIEETYQTTQETAKSYVEVSKLFAQAQDLEAQAKNTQDSEKLKKVKTELLEVQKQIAQVLPSTTSGFTEEGTAISANSDLIREQLDLKKQEMILNAQSFMEQNKNMSDLVKRYREAKDEVNELKIAQAQGRTSITKTIVAPDENGMETEYKYEINIAEALKEKNKFMQDNVSLVQKYNTYAQLLNKYNGDSINIIGLANKKIDENTKMINKNTDAKGDNINQSRSIQEVQAEAVETLSKSKNEIKEVNSVLQKHAETSEWDLDTITKLAKDGYPELLNLIGQDKQLEEELIRVKEDKVNKVQEVFTREIELTNNKLKEYLDINNIAYEDDLTNFTNLAKAKVDILNKLNAEVNKLSNAFADIAKENGYMPKELQFYLEGKKAEVGRIEADFNKSLELQNRLKNFSDMAGKIGDKNYDGKKNTSSKDKSKYESNIQANNAVKLSIDRINESLTQQDKIIQSLEQQKKNYHDSNDLNNELQTQEEINKALENKKNLLTQQSEQLQSMKESLKSEFYSLGINDNDMGSMANLETIYDSKYAGRKDFKSDEEKDSFNDRANRLKQLIENWKAVNTEVDKYNNEMGKNTNDIFAGKNNYYEIKFKIYDDDLKKYEAEIKHIDKLLDTVNKKNYDKRVEVSRQLLNAQSMEKIKLEGIIKDLEKQVSLVKEYSSEWVMLKDKLDGFKDKLIDLNTVMAKNSEILYTEYETSVEDVSNRIINALKNKYQKAKDDLINPLENDLLRLKEELDDLQDDHSEKENKLSSINRELSLWQQDNGVFSKGKIEELEKEKKKIEKELAIKHKQDQIKDKELQKKKIELEYDTKMKEENLRKESLDMIKNHQDKIIDLLQQYEPEYRTKSELLGKAFTDKFKEKLDSAIAKINEFKTAMDKAMEAKNVYINNAIDAEIASATYGQNGYNIKSMSEIKDGKVGDNDILLGANANDYQGGQKVQGKDRYETANMASRNTNKPYLYANTSIDKKILEAQYGDKIKVEVSNGNGMFTGQDRYETNGKFVDYLRQFGLLPKDVGDLMRFKTGGYTGNSQGIAWLDEKELILKDTDTRNILDSVKLNNSIIDKVKSMTNLMINAPKMNIPNMSNIYNNQKSVHIPEGLIKNDVKITNYIPFDVENNTDNLERLFRNEIGNSLGFLG